MTDTNEITPTKGFDWHRLKPSYWGQNYPTCRHWDAVLNALLDKFEPEVFGYTCTLGGVEVWASNWPYAYGSPYSHGWLDVLPMVATRKRLRQAVSKASCKDALAALAKARGESA